MMDYRRYFNEIAERVLKGYFFNQSASVFLYEMRAVLGGKLNSVGFRTETPSTAPISILKPPRPTTASTRATSVMKAAGSTQTKSSPPPSITPSSSRAFHFTAGGSSTKTSRRSHTFSHHSLKPIIRFGGIGIS